jgi:hypothetical protein
MDKVIPSEPSKGFLRTTERYRVDSCFDRDIAAMP